MTADSSVYIRSFPGDKFIILLFYVVDMLIVGVILANFG